jgi:flagellar hook-associated protein FlgK
MRPASRERDASKKPPVESTRLTEGTGTTAEDVHRADDAAGLARDHAARAQVNAERAHDQAAIAHEEGVTIPSAGCRPEV